MLIDFGSIKSAQLRPSASGRPKLLFIFLRYIPPFGLLLGNGRVALLTAI